MEDKLKKLIGQKVTKSSSGGGAGSILLVEFEDGSYLFTYCDWRIERGREVLATSSDTIVPSKFSDSPNGVIGKTGPILVGNKVLDLMLSPQYDLDLFLENGYKLRLFCIFGHSQEGFDINWGFYIPKENLSIEITNHFEEQTFPYDRVPV